MRVRPVDGSVMPVQSSTGLDLGDGEGSLELFRVGDVDEDAFDVGAVAVASRVACARRAGGDARSCFTGAF